jgi:hypothetical protein
VGSGRGGRYRGEWLLVVDERARLLGYLWRDGDIVVGLRVCGGLLEYLVFGLSSNLAITVEAEVTTS